MSARIPRFAPGVRLRHDASRDAWVLLAPERLLMPDETALAVLREIDGARSEDAIVEILAARYDAPRDVIGADVAALIDEMTGSGLLRP